MLPLWVVYNRYFLLLKYKLSKQRWITIESFYIFFKGCVWVYRIYKPSFEESDPEFCNKTVYVFAFWLITTAYIFLGLFTSCICCFSIVSVIFKREY